ncbi:hypothetical protein GH714_028558 [Hevea brasiliensis]|uniref:TOD1/MUCI70 glycosyltransferase-like domain-containing protein n=1 Tax=Hevea brasiliensis TaxID=3981 RepID=A0A6A6NCL3_HEVBR|nr:hypothetical protein GH714_028558 [Hevea brasiliensis]
MEKEIQRSITLRISRRGDRSNPTSHFTSKEYNFNSSFLKIYKRFLDLELVLGVDFLIETDTICCVVDPDGEGGFLSSGNFSSDYPSRIMWKHGFICLVLVAAILWMLLILVVLLFHVWSCQSSYAFFSAICNKESKVYNVLNTWGFVAQQHRCPIPVANNPNKIVIPEGGTPDNIVKNLSYFMEDELVNNGTQPSPLFGGHQSWSQREESFKLNSSMKVHCGFMRGGGTEMDPMDIKYVNKCRFAVASGIFDGYDVPHQPSNMSDRSKKLFCFLMVVDEASLDFIKEMPL